MTVLTSDLKQLGEHGLSGSDGITIERFGRGYVLHAEAWLPQPIDIVFAFFSDAGNLEAITPPWLRFRIITPLPIAMRAGTRIDYRIRLHGISIGWRTAITFWEPPFRFTDEQRQGPYRRWVHTHTFETHRDGTIVRDRVEFDALGGWLAHRLLIAPDLRKIFTYRHQRMIDLLGKRPEASVP